MSPGRSPHAWARGYVQREPGPVPKTQTALYRLSDLIARDYIDSGAGREMLLDAGLADVTWQVTWVEDFDTTDEDLENRFGDVDGYAVFVHGWTGNHTIWEELPGHVVRANRRIVAIALDHNGFGGSPFSDPPDVAMCNPPAAMRALEAWVDVVKIRRQPGERAPKVINFVGHSMGGATLFYLNPINWRFGEETRYALAPALLLHDQMHRRFYTTLGFGIGLVDRIRAFRPIEQAIKPELIDTLCAGSSDYVKQAHHVQYEATERSTTATTFTAMGKLDDREMAHKWDLFRVMLGHKDRLVGLIPMMDLLSDLEMPSGHIRVVPGTHYMFSIGPDSAYHHAQNRELVVNDLLHLHRKAYEMQKAGVQIG
jgi:pimeloyl-ACP methyl ester carboxylesterase